ncbi:hypothetical protein C0991_002293 [Blastosporella zonata]|nr:hypothetical protein C0991_002293 [Blastosporella zonata]
MLSPDDYPWANAGQWTHSPALDDPQEAPPQASYYEPRSTVTKQSSPPKRRVSKVQDESYRYSKELPPLVYEKYNYDSQTKQTGLPNRRESKPAPDEFRQYQEVPPTSNHDIYDALTKQSVPYKRKESLRNPTSKSNSWQSAPDGNWRYIGRSAEFDLEAQSRLPATPNQFSTHVPGHSTKADLPTQMEPLAPGTTPPPSPIQTFHILPSLNSHVDSINPSRQHYASTSYPFSPRIEYKFPHHVEIKQPRATRSINFDILAMHGEFEEPRVPNSDKVRNITVQYVGQAYKEFLRLTREVEKRFGGKREEHGNRPPVVLRKPDHHPNASGHRHVRTATPRPPEHLSDKQTGAFLSPSKTSPDTASDSDASYHDCLTESSVKPSPVPEKPRAISTNVATFDTTPARRTRSQQYASAYSRMERSFPPTSHAAVCGLYLVNDTLHRMDLLDVVSCFP